MKVSRLILTAALAAIVNGPQAFAHISYTDRQFGTLSYYTPATILPVAANRTLSSSFGWADATDANWGDSHRGRFYSFTLASTSTVIVTAERSDNTLIQTGAAGVFLPAFSIYKGIAPASTHDSSPNTVNWLRSQFGNTAVAESFTDSNPNSVWDTNEPFTDTNNNAVWDSAGLGDAIDGYSGKEGAANALGNWRIYSDGGAFVDFEHVGHAADGTSANFGNAAGITGDDVADGYVTAMFTDLAPGNYSVFLAGASNLAQFTEPGPSTFPTYTVGLTLQAIPEPCSYALIAGAGALGFLSLRRRRRA